MRIADVLSLLFSIMNFYFLLPKLTVIMFAFFSILSYINIEFMCIIYVHMCVCTFSAVVKCVRVERKEYTGQLQCKWTLAVFLISSS